MGGEFLEPLFCPACSYDLRGSAGERCPECGHDLTELRSGLPVIPWTLRRLHRWIPTFWTTVWLVTFRTRRFLNKFGQGVDYRDARRFQWMVVVHAYLPILIASVYLYVTAPPGARVNEAWASAQRGGFPFTSDYPTLAGIAYAEFWPAALVHFGYILFLFAASGAASYFFHPKSLPMRLQNNAVAMSYYAVAPLAWTPVLFIGLTALLGAASRWTEINPGVEVGIALHGLAVVSLLVTLAWTWGLLLFVGWKMMPREARWWRMAAALPVIWAMLGGICLALIPTAVLYVLVAVKSLTG